MTYKEQLDMARIPAHIAIIMDGNGRWAKARGLDRSMGHQEGVAIVREITTAASNLGVKYLTLYTFSTENWNRSREEVAALMQLILDFFASEIDELDARNVRILILGDKTGLPDKQREVLVQAEDRTCGNTGLKLNIALNYGGRAELARAARELALLVQSGEITPAMIDERAMADHLYTHGQPDVDLLIRTSGEMRLSNFMLYQCAYAEFLFPTVLWPDFTVADYDEALRAYGGRERRFGGRTPR